MASPDGEEVASADEQLMNRSIAADRSADNSWMAAESMRAQEKA